MSYLYIKKSLFDINNLIIKFNNNCNLVLNYNIPQIGAKLKNLIFHFNNHVLLTEKVSDSGFHTKSKSHFKIILNGDMKIILDLIDDKIIGKMNESEYEYIPIVNKSEEGCYINIYINNINLEKSKYIIDTYIQLKFKLINNKLIPRLYTYNLKYN